MTSIDIQVGLFGGEGLLTGYHVVSAHTRTLEDGSEVFVGEHLRWNRGRTAFRGTTPAPAHQEPSEDQMSLFPR